MEIPRECLSAYLSRDQPLAKSIFEKALEPRALKMKQSILEVTNVGLLEGRELWKKVKKGHRVQALAEELGVNLFSCLSFFFREETGKKFVHAETYQVIPQFNVRSIQRKVRLAEFEGKFPEIRAMSQNTALKHIYDKTQNI